MLQVVRRSFKTYPYSLYVTFFVFYFLFFFCLLIFKFSKVYYFTDRRISIRHYFY